MHILEIPSFFPPYGGWFCLDQSKALAAQGHTVRIVACVQLGVTISRWQFVTAATHVEKRQMDGIEVYYRQLRGWPLCKHRNMKRWVSAVEQMAARYVAAHGVPDIIHAHCAKWAGCAAQALSRRYGVPYVITEHLSHQVFETELHGRTDAWQIPLLKDAYREAARVVAVSEELVADIAPYFGTDYRHTAISNTIDTRFFAYREREPKGGRPMRFCCLAMFIPLKGYDVLLKAFRTLVEQRRVDACLAIAGTYTDSPRLAAMVKALKLEDRVKMYGLVDKQRVRDILYQSDCLVLASRSEAQGLVLLEAMSTGIPVITTEVAPQAMRITGCHVVPVDDVEALAGMMEQVALSPADGDSRQMSQHVAEMSSPEAVGSRLSKLFSEIVSMQ